MTEKSYYPRFRKWLEERGYYCGGKIFEGKNGQVPKFYEDVGTKTARADVAGVRHFENYYTDDLEVAVIEVREQSTATGRDIGDASNYHDFAHRVYLGTTGSISESVLDVAERNDVGVLRIDGKNRITPLRSATAKVPNNPGRVIEFLRALSIVQCTFCQCYFHEYHYGEEQEPEIGEASFFTLHRAKFFKVIDKHDPSTMSTEEVRKLNKSVRVKRHLCRNCVHDIQTVIEGPVVVRTSKVIRDYLRDQYNLRLEMHGSQFDIFSSEKRIGKLQPRRTCVTLTIGKEGGRIDHGISSPAMFEEWVEERENLLRTEIVREIDAVSHIPNSRELRILK